MGQWAYLDDGYGNGWLDGFEVFDGRDGGVDEAVADGVLEVLDLAGDLVEDAGDVDGASLIFHRVHHPLDGLLALGGVGINWNKTGGITLTRILKAYFQTISRYLTLEKNMWV